MQNAKKKFYLLCIVFIIALANTIIAINILQFDGYSTPENLTFTSSQNFTRNITIYRYANVTGAFMNLSGFLSQTKKLDFGSDAVSSGTGNSQDFTTEGTTIFKIIAHLKQSSGAGYVFGWVINSSNDVISSNETVLVENSYYSVITFDFDDFDVTNNTNYSMVIHGNGTTDIQWKANNTDKAMSVYFGKYPNNVYIEINNTKIFNHPEELNHTYNSTDDFYTTLNTTLNNGACDCNGCKLIDTQNCSINFTIHSDNAGILQYSDMNISWLEYLNPNLTINQPATTHHSTTNIPLNITVEDDWIVDYCWFNVTRGASLEYSNHEIKNCHNTTFTVSGDATYVLHIEVRDKSKNSNYTNYSFEVIDYIPPISRSGGGGGGWGAIEDVEEIKEDYCDPAKPKLEDAWKKLLDDLNWETFKIFWFAFWDYGTCKQTASFLPL